MGEFGVLQTILMMVAICVMFMIILIFQHQLKHVLRIVIRAIAGGFGIVLCNFALSMLGVSVTVGVNFLTLLIIALLGIPGFAAVYFISYLL